LSHPNELDQWMRSILSEESSVLAVCEFVKNNYFSVEILKVRVIVLPHFLSQKPNTIYYD